MVSNKPGIIFINSEEMFVDLSGVYRVKESATGKTFSLCKEPEHLKFLDKQDSKVFFDRIKISEVQIEPSLLKEEQKLDLPKGIQFFDNKKQREDEPLIKQENITEHKIAHKSLKKTILQQI